MENKEIAITDKEYLVENTKYKVELKMYTHKENILELEKFLKSLKPHKDIKNDYSFYWELLEDK